VSESGTGCFDAEHFHPPTVRIASKKTLKYQRFLREKTAISHCENRPILVYF
jgi:hypothetical protein